SLLCIALEIEFLGKAAHAGNFPYEGTNALDAVIEMFNSINAMRQQMKSEARIHGVILNGGDSPNIIPDYTRARVFVRASDAQYFDGLVQRVKNCALGAGTATGC